MCSALLMLAAIFLYPICGKKGKKILQLYKPHKKDHQWRKSAVDPQNFKPYINICVDLPCCQTCIWFLFLVMAVDLSTGLQLINTEAVHIWYLQKHTPTRILCLCSHLLCCSQPWPMERTGGLRRLWWICQKQGVCISKQHVYAHLTILHPVAELSYLFSRLYCSALCKPHPQTIRYIDTEVFTEKIKYVETLQRRHTNGWEQPSGCPHPAVPIALQPWPFTPALWVRLGGLRAWPIH